MGRAERPVSWGMSPARSGRVTGGRRVNRGRGAGRALVRARRLLAAGVLAIGLVLCIGQPVIAADATYAITGVVTVPSGAPAVGVSVRLDSWSGFLVAVQTSADGRYRLDGLRAGSYTLRAIAPVGSGLQAAWLGDGPSAGGRAEPTFEVAADRVADLQFRLGGTLTGIVRLNGQPRAGVKVCPDYPADPTRCVYSGTDGRYTLTELPTLTEPSDGQQPSGVLYPPTAFPGAGDPFVTTVDWSAAFHGRHLPTFGVPDASRTFTQDIDLAPVPYVSGRVVATTGVPIKGASVCTTGGNVRRCTSTNAGGAFQLRVDLLAWDDVAVLSVRRAGFRTASAVSISQARIDEPAVLTLTPMPKLHSHRPRLVGYRYLGSTLRVAKGSWTRGATLSYRWYRDGKPIAHATRSVHRLSAADVGKRIKVRVTGRKAGYLSVARSSASTLRVGVRPARGR